MELQKALDQISEIHGQLAKTEVYKSYKSFPVALSGLLALGVAILQPKIIQPADATQFVLQWTMVAVACLAMSGVVILYNYLVNEDTIARRTTRRVLAQFLPAVASGALVTVAILSLGDKAVRLLPGCWAVLYSMGIFAARPYLPRAVGWVALFYLSAGSILLVLAKDGSSLSPWGMGTAFGIGQILTAVVLYWNLERSE